MARNPARAAVEAPSIELGDFQIWVHRRQFPDAEDRWDGNWLHVTAQCAQAGAIVVAGGPILDAADVERFRDELAAVRASGSGQAVLSGAEPDIRVRVAAGNGRGDLRVRVELTPDPQAQGHWFEYAVDQSYLPETIRQLDAVLELFPVRGRAPSLARSRPGSASAVCSRVRRCSSPASIRTTPRWRRQAGARAGRAVRPPRRGRHHA